MASVNTTVAHLGAGWQQLCFERLLMDVRELANKAFPGIVFHLYENDIYTACLSLYPEGRSPIHLCVKFSDRYPLVPPTVTLDMGINNSPIVIGQYGYVTLSYWGWRPENTLRGLAISLLVTFGSEGAQMRYIPPPPPGVVFPMGTRLPPAQQVKIVQNPNWVWTHDFECANCGFGGQNPLLPAANEGQDQEQTEGASQALAVNNRPDRRRGIATLSTEILVMVIDALDDSEDVTNFGSAWGRAGRIIHDFDIIRKREIKCYCLKKTYEETDLGTGIYIIGGHVYCDWDILSWQAFTILNIRQPTSYQDRNFRWWFPLPLSTAHWERVKGKARDCLGSLVRFIGTITPSSEEDSSPSITNAKVVITFMNDIVVLLNFATQLYPGTGFLRRRSENAINAFFHLFHLLVCLVVEDPVVGEWADRQLLNFQDGRRSTPMCPNLGHLLIMLAISSVQNKEAVMEDFIEEAITRNVPYLLHGADSKMMVGMKEELAYMERDEVSEYRINKTYRGNANTYRFLMISELLCRTARPSYEKSLGRIQKELFGRVGGPPPGAAGVFVDEVQRLMTIDSFTGFFREMGVNNIPTPAELTEKLRATVFKSMERGYSTWALDQDTLMQLRYMRDPEVNLTEEELELVRGPLRPAHGVNFFPVNLFFPYHERWGM